MDLSKDKIDATLVFLIRRKSQGQEVLLAQKVRKLIVNCFNGFGGSMNKGETARACTVRELGQEAGFRVQKRDLEFAGIVTFHNQREDHSEFAVKVFIFLLRKWTGKLKLKEDEMVNSQWFKTWRLPLKRMAPGDQKFVPELLNNVYPDKLLLGEIWYGPKQEELLGYDIKWVERTSDID